MTFTAPEKLIAFAAKLHFENCSVEAALQQATLHGIDPIWTIQLLAFWRTTETKQGKLCRYIEPQFFGDIRLDYGNVCRLCGLSVKPPRRSWHDKCWEALEPFTASGWHNTAYKSAKINSKCQHCLIIDFTDIDHIVPIAAGGLPHPSNQQLLCSQCHLDKTKIDLQTIKQFKAQQCKSALWYMKYLE